MSKNISGIYLITNTVNGKKYYGSSANVWGRKRQHWHTLRIGKHRNPHLQAAWNLYGESAFTFALVEEVPVESLVAVEQRYLDESNDGYNIGKFADAPARGRKRSAECCARMSAARKGRKLSPEHKALLSLRGQGRVVRQETREKLRVANSGKRLSDAVKEKVSIAMKSVWTDESYREKTLNAQSLGKKTEEARRNYSSAMIARWADQDQRKKLSTARKACWANPEYRAKMLAIRKKQGKRCSGKNWRDRPKKVRKSNART